LYVCICKAVTEREILAARELGAETPEAIAECLGAGAGCGRCREAVSDCLALCGAGDPSRQLETEAA
jgi:bacterioferritin-associated ferredoxin